MAYQGSGNTTASSSAPPSSTNPWDKWLASFGEPIICAQMGSKGVTVAKANIEAPRLLICHLDVFVGDATLLWDGETSVLIDTGRAAWTKRVVKAIKEYGIDRLDWLVISHFDADHSGGFAHVIDELKPKNIVTPGTPASILGAAHNENCPLRPFATSSQRWRDVTTNNHMTNVGKALFGRCGGPCASHFLSQFNDPYVGQSKSAASRRTRLAPHNDIDRFVGRMTFRGRGPCTLYGPQSLPNARIEFPRCRAFLQLLNDTQYDVRMRGTESGVNSDSMAWRIEYAGISYYTAGDLEHEQENGLSIDQTDIIKCGHHGTRDATYPTFLKKTRPSMAIVTSGGGGYGHPHQELLNRLSTCNVRTFVTNSFYDRKGSFSVSGAPGVPGDIYLTLWTHGHCTIAYPSLGSDSNKSITLKVAAFAKGGSGLIPRVLRPKGAPLDRFLKNMEVAKCQPDDKEAWGKRNKQRVNSASGNYLEEQSDQIRRRHANRNGANDDNSMEAEEMPQCSQCGTQTENQCPFCGRFTCHSPRCLIKGGSKTMCIECKDQEQENDVEDDDDDATMDFQDEDMDYEEDDDEYDEDEVRADIEAVELDDD